MATICSVPTEHAFTGMATLLNRSMQSRRLGRCCSPGFQSMEKRNEPFSSMAELFTYHIILQLLQHPQPAAKVFGVAKGGAQVLKAKFLIGLNSHAKFR